MREVFVNPSRRRSGLSLGAVVVVAIVIPDANVRGIMLASVAVIALAVVRAKLILTDDGVIVVNYLRHKIAWEDITGIVAMEAGINSPRALSLVIEARNRRLPVTSWAVSTAVIGLGSRKAWVRQVTDRVATEWVAREHPPGKRPPGYDLPTPS